MRLTVLGSTGSIGRATLDLAARHGADVEVYALAAHSNHQVLLEQCRKHRPRHAVLADEGAARALAQAISAEGLETQVETGTDAVCTRAADPSADCVMAGMAGMVGLAPAWAAVQAGRRVLLANKEALVSAGRLFMEAVRDHACILVPVDSEHNALHQCLAGTDPDKIDHIYLTASGGPFRGRPQEDLEEVTPDEACAHPTWDMGPKISVDSATMMNKGLEVIEARWLFDLEPSRIDVVIHPQSRLHAMVTLRDGSTLAHLGPSDMRVPISYALFGSERRASGVSPLDPQEMSGLSWSSPEPGLYPCLSLARQALEAGGAAPAVLNAANEVAVETFLAGAMRFTDIPRVVETTLSEVQEREPESLEEVYRTDAAARHAARQAAQEAE